MTQFVLSEHTNILLNVLKELDETGSKFSSAVMEVYGQRQGADISEEYFRLANTLRDYIYDYVVNSIDNGLAVTGGVDV